MLARRQLEDGGADKTGSGGLAAVSPETVALLGATPACVGEHCESNAREAASRSARIMRMGIRASASCSRLSSAEISVLEVSSRVMV